MKVRTQIELALLPKLKELYPAAEGSDLLFFGGRADIASPLPAKYGLDIAKERVYNIKDETMIGELRLLSSVEIADGFINFTLSDEALGSFTEDCAGYGEGELLPVIPAGDTPEYAHAALLGICLRPGEEGGAVPSDPEARKALWLCLSADSPASFNLAANKICAVLKKHRKTPVLTKRAARAMAASLRRNIIEYKKTE